MKGFFIFSRISLSAIYDKKIIITFSFYSEVPRRYLLFFKDFHGINNIGILFAYHEDLAKSSSPYNFNKVEIVFWYLYLGIEHISCIICQVDRSLALTEQILPVYLAVSPF